MYIQWELEICFLLKELGWQILVFCSTWMKTPPSQGLKYLHIPTCTYLQNIFYISNCQIWFCSFGIELFFYLLFYTVQYFRHIFIKWSILPFPENSSMKHKFFFWNNEFYFLALFFDKMKGYMCCCHLFFTNFWETFFLFRLLKHQLAKPITTS